MKQIVLAVIVGVFIATICLINANAWADNATKTDTAKTDGRQATATAPAEADFMKVIEKCAKCHKKPCASIDSLKQAKWIVPGKPENSPVYKVIGKCKKTGGIYHNLTDEEKKTVNDFIKNVK